MIWERGLDIESRASVRSFGLGPYDKDVTAIDPTLKDRLELVQTRAPWLTPETSLALAKSYASVEAIDALGDMASRRDIDNQGKQMSNLMAFGLKGVGTGLRWVGNAAGFGWHWLGKGLSVVPGAMNAVNQVGESLYQTGQLFKTPVKYGTAALDIVPEGANYLASKLVGEPLLRMRGRPIEHFDQPKGGFWDQFSITQLLKNPEESGSGFFISEEMRQSVAAEQRARRGTINGSAFTLGRGAASMVFKPGSESYLVASGLVDLVWNLKLPDPTKLVTKGMEAWRLAAGVVPLISEADRPSLMRAVQGGTHFEHTKKVDAIEAYLSDIRKGRFADDEAAVLRAQAGLSESLAGGTVDFQKFTNFMKTNSAARTVVKRLVEEKSAGKIFRDHFDMEITTDTAFDLAMAKTEDEVIGVLTGAYTFGEQTISRRIADYSNRSFITQKSPFMSGLRRTRLFSEVPDSFVVVAGDNLDNMKSVRNMVNSLRAAGVANKDIEDWADEAVKAFRSTATSADVYKARSAYQNHLRLVLKQNGIADPVVEEVLRGSKEGIDQMRGYFLNRMGIATDNGLLAHMLDQVKGFLSPEEVARTMDRVATAGGGFGYDLTFGSPVQFADMLNRVQVLPDPRQLRRLTRNSLMTEYLSKLPVEGALKSQIMKKRAVFSKKGRREIEVITDQKAYDELTAREQALMDSLDPTNKDPKTLQELNQISYQKDALIETQTKRVLTGDQRQSIAIIEWMQNGLWKPFTLMTGGYTMRNMIDAQVRMAFGDLSGAINHPFHYISLVTGRKLSKSILGEDIVGGGLLRDVGAEKGAINAEDLRKELREVLTNGGRVQGLTDSDFGRHLYKTGSFAKVSRGDAKYGMVQHTDGMIQQLGKVYRDELQRTAARGLAFGYDQDQVVEMVVQKIRSNPEYYNEVSKIYDNGLEYIEGATGRKYTFPSFNITDIGKEYGRAAADDILRAHARKIVFANVEQVTGNIDALRFAAAFDHTPFVDAGGQMVREVLSPDEFKVVVKGSMLEPENPEDFLGRLVNMNDGRNGIVVNQSKGLFTVVPVAEESSLTKYRGGSRGLKKIVSQSPIWDQTTGVGIPPVILREISGTLNTDKKLINSVSAGLDRATNYFFNVLNEAESRVLERSPVFRQYYYRNVAEHINRLSPEEAQKVIDDLAAKAEKAGQSIKDYVGDAKITSRGIFGRSRSKTFLGQVEEVAAGGGAGTLTAEHLDDFARFRAIQQTQNLLFDASKTNNLKDILRIVVPFGNAWNEVIANYLKLAAYDGVHALRSFQRVYTGAVNADPDRDGRGFFYKDPQTGNTMFMFPGSAQLSKILTGGGYETPLTAPVKRLSQGLNVYPSIGPMMQFAASSLIPDVPKYDAWVDLLMPYGRTEKFGEALGIPGWAKKLYEIARADTNNMSTTYFNTYIETLRAEANTGNYNLDNAEDNLRLQENAKSKAKWISLLRVASQFIGPTAGSVEFKIPTNSGDMYVRELIKEFSDLQNEDYDSAVERFLNLHGENAALYIAAKSKAQRPGLEATDEFGDWERENMDFANAFPRVANYLAPVGDGFDFATQERQLRQGTRKRQNASEMIDDAQNRIGSSRYRAAKKVFGPYPTADEREKLANYRVWLNQKYPGFPARAEFMTNQYYNDLDELRRLLTDPRAAMSPATPAIKEYMRLRDEAILNSGYKTLSSKAMTSTRSELFRAGEALAAQNPFFGRIWQRLLLREVED